MKVLGIDTSGYANAIGVIDDEKVLADFIFEARTDSLEKIISHIDLALKSANLSLQEVQGIGVGLGPGSWTGIRIGVTVGKILAYSTGKPVCGIPTLEALAHNIKDASRLICPIISAGPQGMVYAAFYRWKNSIITREGEYYAGDIGGLPAIVPEPAILVGSQASSYFNLMNEPMSSADISIKVMESVPKGATIALLAAARFQRGESDEPLSLTPLYLKESTARAFQRKSSQTKA